MQRQKPPAKYDGASANAIVSGLHSPFGINYDADWQSFVVEGGSGRPDPNSR